MATQGLSTKGSCFPHRLRSSIKKYGVTPGYQILKIHLLNQSSQLAGNNEFLTLRGE